MNNQYLCDPPSCSFLEINNSFPFSLNSLITKLVGCKLLSGNVNWESWPQCKNNCYNQISYHHQYLQGKKKAWIGSINNCCFHPTTQKKRWKPGNLSNWLYEFSRKWRYIGEWFRTTTAIVGWFFRLLGSCRESYWRGFPNAWTESQKHSEKGSTWVVALQ